MISSSDNDCNSATTHLYPRTASDYTIDEHLLSKSQINLIRWMWPTTSYQYDQLCTAYRSYLKVERCGLTEHQCNALGFNIDLVGSVTLEQTLRNLASGGWLFIDEGSNHVTMTAKCQNWLHAKLTRRFGSQWQSWRTELQRIHAMVSASAPAIDEHLAIMHYANGLTSQQAARWFRWSDTQLKANETICASISQQLGIAKSELHQHRVFHINPTLKFVDVEVASTFNPVSLAVEITYGNTVLSLPECHVSAINDDHFAITQLNDIAGYFIEIPSNIDQLSVSCLWRIHEGDKLMSVSHNMSYNLLPTACGWLYSANAEMTAQPNSQFFAPESFYQLEALTGNRNVTPEKLQDIPRVRVQIQQLELKPNRVKIVESLSLSARTPHQASTICL